jgi:hypothetical protein
MMTSICDFVSQHRWTLLIDAVLTALLAYPVCVFLYRGWDRTAAEVCDHLTPKAKKRYLAIYQKKQVEEAGADAAFKAFYTESFGRKFFVIPISFLFAVTIFGNFFLAQSLLDLLKPAATAKQLNIASAAIAGAYMTVCWSLFGDMQRRTLSRAGILRNALRLVVALPVGFAFAALLAEGLAPFAAFAMGAFPLQTIIVILQRQMKKRLELEALDPKIARDQVFLLTGIDTPIAERIEDADISTITQLAWADPVQLTMRTNLQFAFILDIISQALAWVYLEDKLRSFGIVGLRGAVEIRSALKDVGVIDPDDDDESRDRLDDHVVVHTREVAVDANGVRETDTVEVIPQARPALENPETRAAKAAIAEAAKIAKVDEQALMNALIQIGKDPTARFLDISWSSLNQGG